MSNPVFIHSLFRAGSTYIFNVFRRSTENYHCFQEPLHEMAIYAADNPELLLEGFNEEAMNLNRHPEMELPYFQELYDSWPVWKSTLSPSAVYQNYFSLENSDTSLSFWGSLVNCFDEGRVIFQECRTSGRIQKIKQELGGFHIYLWRNPWDQWWSYKTTSYFDMINKLIIQAEPSPNVILGLRKELNIKPFDVSNISEAFLASYSAPLTSNQSYLIFYTLWCLGLRAGIRNADLMINIDQLTESSSYQESILSSLEKEELRSINFLDCKIFQGHYSKKDAEFFLNLEKKVENWLLNDDWSEGELSELKRLREKHSPNFQKEVFKLNSEKVLSEQSSRMRQLVFDYERALSELSANKEDEISEYKEIINLAEHRANHEGHRANLEERRAIRAEQRINDAESRANKEVHRANKEGHRANAAEKHIEEILNSTSWRVTVGLRLFGKFFRYISQSLRYFAGKLLKSFVSSLRRNPKVFSFCLSIVNKFPGLKLKLKKSILNNDGRATPITPSVLYYSNLSPRGREIYSELEQLSNSVDG